MKKIIQSNEADKYICPTRSINNCLEKCAGSGCMKWEEETEKKACTDTEIQTVGDRSIAHTVTVYRDVKTGYGWCGL